MDALAISGLQISPEKYFDRILDIRAEKREHLRGRNNVTSCRSPAREINTRQLKNELKEKRHLEFLRRRSVSPEPCERSSRRKSPVFSGKYHSSSYSREAVQTNTQNAKGHPLIALTPNSSTTDDPGSSKWVNDFMDVAGLPADLFSCLCRSTVNNTCTYSLLSFPQASFVGFLQKFPKDGVKKLVVQMEKQRMVYEEKALIALQKATQEKTEALTKAEALRWQSLYEELKLSSGHLRESQHLSNEQLEHELREEVLSLRQEKQDLQYNICLLEEDNQTLREEIQHLRGKTFKSCLDEDYC
uniref:Uncharacterized protein n=1 Tax=Amphilophus citrinellus TaxID=61819 RepID=A0A3Q0RE02_AMPCI